MVEVAVSVIANFPVEEIVPPVIVSPEEEFKPAEVNEPVKLPEPVDVIDPPAVNPLVELKATAEIPPEKVVVETAGFTVPVMRVVAVRLVIVSVAAVSPDWILSVFKFEKFVLITAREEDRVSEPAIVVIVLPNFLVWNSNKASKLRGTKL